MHKCFTNVGYNTHMSTTCPLTCNISQECSTSKSHVKCTLTKCLSRMVFPQREADLGHCSLQKGLQPHGYAWLPQERISKKQSVHTCTFTAHANRKSWLGDGAINFKDLCSFLYSQPPPRPFELGNNLHELQVFRVF